MRVLETHLVDRAGVNAIAHAVLTELGWLFREQDISDVGVDAQLEVVEHGEATGRLLAVQIKSGRSWFDEPAAEGWWFRCGEEHAAYWRGHSLPVVVMLQHPEQERVYWQHVTDDTLISTGRGWKILVPAAQQLTAEAAKALAAPARPQPDAFQAAVDRLPRDARIALLRDHQAGAPYAAGLAVLLAQAADPATVVRTLLEDPPGWLSGLHGEQRAGAWRAVAGYAVAHQLGPVAVDALEHATDAVANAADGDGDSGIDAGRLRALAAIVAAGTDPGRAQALIAAAEASSPVLAAVARALLPGPSPGQLPQLPETIARALAAGDEAAVGDPTVMGFVARTHFAAGRHDEGMAALEAAMNRAPDDPGLQAEMAAALTRHTTTGAPILAYLDVQRAYRLALAARAGYRRWRGPSAGAALVLLRVRTIDADISAALRTAVPAPDGEAQGPESGSAPLLLEAARLAYHAGQHDLAGSFAQQLTEAGARAQLAAVAVDSRPDATTAQRVTAWTSALEEATDDDQRMVAAMTLTGLGEWPVAALDRLRDEGAVSEAVYHVRWACAEAVTGDQDAAIRRLRQWEATSVTAAMALVGLYEDTGDLTAAADAAERAGNRFGDLALRLHAVKLWSRADQPERARLRALTLLSRPFLPAALRQQLRGSAVQWAYDRQDWLDMEDHALAGLAEERGSDLLPAASGTVPLSDTAASFAWAAIRAQLQARRLDAAHATLTRYTPPVRRAEEARLWMTIVDWAGWTLADAEQALTLAEHFAADTPVRAFLLARLLHATGGPRPQDADLATPARPPLLLPDHLRHTLQTLLDDTPTSGSELNHLSLDDLSAHLQQTLAPRQPFIDACKDAVRTGAAPLGMLARAADRPVTLALIQRAAGLIPAATLHPAHLAAELAAAARALNTTVTLDITAVAVATLLPGRFDQLRARFTTTPIPTPAYDDLVNTRYALDTLLRSSGQLGLHDGQPAFTALSDAGSAPHC